MHKTCKLVPEEKMHKTCKLFPEEKMHILRRLHCPRSAVFIGCALRAVFISRKAPSSLPSTAPENMNIE